MDAMTILIAACTFDVLCIIIQSFVLWLFLSKTSMIADEADLNRFKKIARMGMYLSLLVMPVILVMMVCSLIICISQGFGGLARVVLLSAILIVAARLGTGLEVRVRSLTTTSEQLEEEYRQIVKTWVEKAFPDF